MWAPEHPRLVDFLAALPDTVSEVSATELRFGSRGQVSGRTVYLNPQLYRGSPIVAVACGVAPAVQLMCGACALGNY